MSRALSPTATAAIMAQETGEVFLLLLKIDHENLETPIRVANNWVNVTSGGNTYKGYGFKFGLIPDTEDRPAQVPLQIDNVERLLVETVRTITSPPSADLSVVLAGSPDTIEAGPFEFMLHGVEYDDLVMTGTLAYEAILDELFPGDAITPNNFPGVYGGLPPGSEWTHRRGERGQAFGVGSGGRAYFVGGPRRRG